MGFQALICEHFFAGSLRMEKDFAKQMSEELEDIGNGGFQHSDNGAS